MLKFSEESETERESSHLLGHLLKFVGPFTQPGVDYTEAKSQEFNPHLLHGWQEPCYLSHHCSLPGCVSAGNWHKQLVVGTEFRKSDR